MRCITYKNSVMNYISVRLARNLTKSDKVCIILWCSTFLVILPFLAQSWVFSPYFYASQEYKSNAHQLVEHVNKHRFFEAEKYLSALTPKDTEELHSKGLRPRVKSSIVAMVITMKRLADCEPGSHLNSSCEPHYLQQTLVALDREVKTFVQDGGEFIPVVICNADPNWKEFQDFKMVQNTFPVIYRYAVEPERRTASTTLQPAQVKRAQESSDYSFCLDALFNITNGKPKYALVFQDDALAFPNFFKNLFYILNSRVERKQVRGEWVTQPEWSYLKLYYPEKWTGFSWNFDKTVELWWIALFGALVGLFFKLWLFGEPRASRNRSQLLTCGLLSAAYAVLVVASISRQTLLEIRRVSPFFLKVKQGSGCCIPAMIYQMKFLPSIVEYLNSPSTAGRRSEVDLALDDFTTDNGLKSYLVEPNLIQHIGMYSSLTDRKNATQFLFYDLMYGS